MEEPGFNKGTDKNGTCRRVVDTAIDDLINILIFLTAIGCTRARL